MAAPASVELTGWRKYFNSYTLPGRRNLIFCKSYCKMIRNPATHCIVFNL
uniref:Uncharacterized protein n=1 Tax=Seriola lalandi dorsalis TaxID=1841481 RepID=A0A3B4Z4H2_SERLL